MLGTNFKVFYSRHIYAGKMALDVTFEANWEKPRTFGGYKEEVNLKLNSSKSIPIRSLVTK